MATSNRIEGIGGGSRGVGGGGGGRVSKIVSTVKSAAKTKANKAANARGLKAANKPTNKTGTAADRADRKLFQGQTNIIKNASPARANRTRGGSLASIKAYGGQGLVSVKLTPKQAARQKEISKELNPARKVKPKTK